MQKKTLEDEIYHEVPENDAISYGLLFERVIEDGILFIPNIQREFNQHLQNLIAKNQIQTIQHNNTTYYTRKDEKQ